MVGERLYVTPHFTLHAPHFILHTPHSTLYTFHSTLHTLHFTLDTPDSTLDALHFTLYTLPFTLYTLRSTLYTLHCTLPPQQSLSTPYCNDPQPAGSSSTRSPNHLQHLWNCYPCFATLRHPFLSITSHPLANSLVPNPNERCSPLSFGVPPFSSVFPLLWTIFLRFLSFFSYLFPVIPPFSSIFPLFSTIFLHFPWFFPPFFLPESTDLGGIEPYRHLFA